MWWAGFGLVVGVEFNQEQEMAEFQAPKNGHSAPKHNPISKNVLIFLFLFLLTPFNLMGLMPSFYIHRDSVYPHPTFQFFTTNIYQNTNIKFFMYILSFYCKLEKGVKIRWNFISVFFPFVYLNILTFILCCYSIHFFSIIK